MSRNKSRFGSVVLKKALVTEKVLSSINISTTPLWRWLMSLYIVQTREYFNTADLKSRFD